MIPWLLGVFGFSEEFFDINNLHGIQIQGLQKVLKISISGRLFFYYGILGLSRIFENSVISSGKKKSPWIYIRCEMTPTSAGGEQQNYIRCEMTPTSVGGEQQISISGGILWQISWKQIRIIVLYVWICARFFIWIKKISSKFNINNQF